MDAKCAETPGLSPLGARADFGTAAWRLKQGAIVLTRPAPTMDRHMISAGQRAPATNGALRGIGTSATS